MNICFLNYRSADTSAQEEKFVFFKKQLSNMFDVKIQLDLYVYTFYVNCEVFNKISLGFHFNGRFQNLPFLHFILKLGFLNLLFLLKISLGFLIPA